MSAKATRGRQASLRKMVTITFYASDESSASHVDLNSTEYFWIFYRYFGKESIAFSSKFFCLVDMTLNSLSEVFTVLTWRSVKWTFLITPGSWSSIFESFVSIQFQNLLVTKYRITCSEMIILQMYFVLHYYTTVVPTEILSYTNVLHCKNKRKPSYRNKL